MAGTLAAARAMGHMSWAALRAAARAICCNVWKTDSSMRRLHPLHRLGREQEKRGARTRSTGAALDPNANLTTPVQEPSPPRIMVNRAGFIPANCCARRRAVD